MILWFVYLYFKIEILKKERNTNSIKTILLLYQLCLYAPDGVGAYKLYGFQRVYDDADHRDVKVVHGSAHGSPLHLINHLWQKHVKLLNLILS